MAGRRAKYLRAHLSSWQCLRRPCSARRASASCLSPAVPVCCVAAMTCWDTPVAPTGWPLASGRASYLISTAAGGRIRTIQGPKLNNLRF